MKNVESQKRLLSIVTSVVLLLVSLFVFANLVRPAIDEVRLAREEATLEAEHLETQKAAKVALDEFLRKYEDAANTQGLLAMALPDEKDVPNAVYQIQKLASNSGLVIEALAINAERDMRQTVVRESGSDNLIKQVSKVKINMTLKGSYDNFKRFLSSIENNIKLMDVRDFVIESAKSGDYDGILTYDLNVEAYYQK